MQTQCSAKAMEFGRAVGAAWWRFFAAGWCPRRGALLLAETDKAIGIVDCFAACSRDARHRDCVRHEVKTLVVQRLFGLALGYEDLLDHDKTRRDPVLGVLLGKQESAAEAPALLAGKSTLNRLEHAPAENGRPRYHKIGHDGAAIERLLVDLFLAAHAKPPRRIVLDLDATDDPLHGHRASSWRCFPFVE